MTSSQKIESMNFQGFFPQGFCEQQQECIKFQDLNNINNRYYIKYETSKPEKTKKNAESA